MLVPTILSPTEIIPKPLLIKSRQL